jgi:two-component system, chemotaxis family, response regulator WspR
MDDLKAFDWTPEGLNDEYPILVLLVDDQLMIGEAVRRMLVEQHNIDFHYCPDPARAVAIAKEVKPTVILQDIVMPGVDGLDLVRHYRAESATANIPVIVLSTKEDAVVKNEAFEAGANDYLVKLPNKIELLARIRYHSRAYLNQVQRDDAYRALRESQHQLLETNFQLQRLTNLDGLTGLSNRRYFDQHIDAEWRRAIRSQNPISILMIDVDNFKNYNDSCGHLAGDEVLKSVAETIRQNCRRSVDCAARFGGEEFVMALTTTTTGESRAAGEKICRMIEDLRLPHSNSSVSSYVTVSIGGALTVPSRGESFFLLIDAADQALYQAKRAGKNKLVMTERYEHDWLMKTS